MKRSMISKLFATLAAVAFLVVGAASAQTPNTLKNAPAATAGITAQLGKIQLDTEHVITHAKKAIPHKPHEPFDPKTGKKVSADTIVEVNGKKMKASEFVAKLNKFDEGLAKLGYSVRNKGKIVLHEAKVDTKSLDETASKLTSLHKAFDAKTMTAIPKHEEAQAKHLNLVKFDADRLKKIAGALGSAPPAKTNGAPLAAAPTSFIKQWNYTLGSKSLAAAYLNGKVEVKGSKDEVTVLGNANAGGYLIGKDISLIKANGSVYSPVKGQSKASLHAYLLGQHVINVEKSGEAAFNLSGSKSHGIDVHASLHFTIGPVPITAKVGAKGNAGVRYTVNVRPAHATMQVTPFVDARVYAQVAADLGIASGGAGGEVILLKDELTFGAELGVDFDSAKGPILTEHVYAQNKMTMLSGKVYAFVRVHVPFFDDPEYRHTIFSWKGLQTNGYLFNIRNTTTLVPNFQAVATRNATSAAK